MGFLSKIKEIKIAFRGGIRLNNSHSLDPQELKKVLVSSMQSLDNNAYIDSYHTGLNTKHLQTIVEDYWKIKDREGAMEIINHLVKRNRNDNLKVIYEAYEVVDYADFLKFRLKEDDQDVVKEFLVYLDRLKEVVPKLLEKGVFTDYEEVKKSQDKGWNLAQGSFLARCCYDLDLIAQSELQMILHRYYQELQTQCDSWQMYTQGYILGKSIEGWPGIDQSIWRAEKLLHHPKSPINTIKSSDF